MSNPSVSVERALQMIRARVPSKIFHLLKDPVEKEIYESIDKEHAGNDEIVDVLLAWSTMFSSPVETDSLELVKQYLLNAALVQSEPDVQLQNEIEAMTVEGVLAKDISFGCLSNPLVAALYAVSKMYPLKSPEDRLTSITSVFSEAAQDLLDYNA